MSSTVYHIEMRQFPHNSCHFNMSEPELRAIAEPWSRQEWVELGEHKWNPHEAKLTILQGPEIPIGQLSMGRGWPRAEREGEDVTERMLAQCRSGGQQQAAATTGEPPAAPADVAGADGAGAGELSALLGEQPQALLEAWRHAAALYRNRTPSQTLALAEEAIGSSGKS